MCRLRNAEFFNVSEKEKSLLQKKIILYIIYDQVEKRCFHKLDDSVI